MNSKQLWEFWAQQEKLCEFDIDIEEEASVKIDKVSETIRRDSTEGKMESNPFKNKGGVKVEDKENFQRNSKTSKASKDIKLIALEGNLVDIPINFYDEGQCGAKPTFDCTASIQHDLVSLSMLIGARKKKETTPIRSTKICQDLKEVLVKAAQKVRADEERRDSNTLRMCLDRLQTGRTNNNAYVDRRDFHIKVSEFRIKS